jgi:hypothetical protein
MTGHTRCFEVLKAFKGSAPFCIENVLLVTDIFLKGLFLHNSS